MLEQRTLGRTGFSVSEIGVALPDDVSSAQALALRAAQGGVTFFLTTDAAVAATLQETLREFPEAVVAYGKKSSSFLLRQVGSGQTQMGIVPASAELPGDDAWSCVVAPYNLVDQDLGTRLFSGVLKRGKGVVAVRVLRGGALAGKAGHAPFGAAVQPFKPLIKPRRTLSQAAILFALANQYVTCAVVRVSTPSHLAEALGAVEAEPLTISELELIFELYANRYDSA